MKFECTTDNTKKFTVGKTYEAETMHAKHNTTLIDDAGRSRLATITHGGDGLRWNSGGKRHATFKRKNGGYTLVGNKSINFLDENGKLRVKLGRLQDEGFTVSAVKKRNKTALIAAVATVAIIATAYAASFWM